MSILPFLLVQTLNRPTQWYVVASLRESDSATRADSLRSAIRCPVRIVDGPEEKREERGGG